MILRHTYLFGGIWPKSFVHSLRSLWCHFTWHLIAQLSSAVQFQWSLTTFIYVFGPVLLRKEIRLCTWGLRSKSSCLKWGVCKVREWWARTAQGWWRLNCMKCGLTAADVSHLIFDIHVFWRIRGIPGLNHDKGYPRLRMDIFLHLEQVHGCHSSISHSKASMVDHLIINLVDVSKIIIIILKWQSHWAINVK